MKKKSLFLAILMIVLIVLSACAGSKNTSFDYAQSAPAAPAPSVVPEYGYFPAGENTSESYDPGSDIFENTDSKIIRTANLTIQTTEFDQAVQALNKLTEQCGGYYEQADVRTGSYYNQYANRYATYTVRIPKENFIQFRDSTGNVGHVYSISENNQNVGEAYYDTEARLDTLTTKHERLLALLEKADKMEDIISLETALADVQYEIDLHTSTLRRYDSLIGFSTFYINLEEVVEIKADAGVKESFASRLASSFKRGMQDFADGFQNFLLWVARNIMGLLIFAVIVVVVVVILRKVIKHRRLRKNKSE